jgi:hypothetical protein
MRKFLITATDALAHELAAEASKACNRRIEVRRFL